MNDRPCPACDAEKMGARQLVSIALGALLADAWGHDGIAALLCEAHRELWPAARFAVDMIANQHETDPVSETCSHGYDYRERCPHADCEMVRAPIGPNGKRIYWDELTPAGKEPT